MRRGISRHDAGSWVGDSGSYMIAKLPNHSAGVKPRAHPRTTQTGGSTSFFPSVSSDDPPAFPIDHLRESAVEVRRHPFVGPEAPVTCIYSTHTSNPVVFVHPTSKQPLPLQDARSPHPSNFAPPSSSPQGSTRSRVNGSGSGPMTLPQKVLITRFSKSARPSQDTPWSSSSPKPSAMDIEAP